MRRYTHRVFFRGRLCSEHSSEALAWKAARRLAGMNKARVTLQDFKVEPIV